MKLKIIFLLLLTGILGGLHFVGSEPPTMNSHSSETVVLLHGMARSSKAMNKIGKALQADGYNVINHNYPSTSATIETLNNDKLMLVDDNNENNHDDKYTFLQKLILYRHGQRGPGHAYNMII